MFPAFFFVFLFFFFYPGSLCGRDGEELSATHGAAPLTRRVGMEK